MRTTFAIAAVTLVATAGAVQAAPVYLNQAAGITVAVGPGTGAGTSNNTFDNGQTINKVIDAASASTVEFHNQTTHIWYTFGNAADGLELLFDFQQQYDISMLHFWNYDGEFYDVDNIVFDFFDATNTQVGTLSIAPALGTSPGQTAQDIALAAPLNVRFVRAFLTGTNGQVDFQNMGFTAEVSAPSGVPEPATWAMMLLGFGAVGSVLRRRRPAGLRLRVA